MRAAKLSENETMKIFIDGHEIVETRSEKLLGVVIYNRVSKR